jgi:hypothetical protein
MKRSVRYEVIAKRNQSALYLSVDDATYAEKHEEHPALVDNIKRLQDERVVDIVRRRKLTTMQFDLAKIGRRTSSQLQHNDLYASTLVASAIGDQEKLSKVAPNLAVALGVYGVGGCLPMQAEIKWPKDKTDEDLAFHATRGMRIVAADLRYNRAAGEWPDTYFGRINRQVYAHVDRSRYVMIGTNPVACG